jgi:hypothetical protein
MRYFLGIDLPVDIKKKSTSYCGLCLIDSNTRYTEIAQGIFRLRNLNIDDTIIFKYTDRNTNIDTSELLILLKNNDKKYKTDQKMLFDFQVAKSSIRKTLFSVNNNIYCENTKQPYEYDYADTFKGNFLKIYPKAFYDEYIKIHTDENMNNKLIELLYNISTNQLTTQQQQQQQQQQQLRIQQINSIDSMYCNFFYYFTESPRDKINITNYINNSINFVIDYGIYIHVSCLYFEIFNFKNNNFYR